MVIKRSIATPPADYNTANGYQALYSNTTGNFNTATGFQALYSNTTGAYNTANGFYALYSNTTGGYNTANGDGALSSNTTGSFNTAVGVYAGSNLTTGSNNIDIGNVDPSTFDSTDVAGESNTIRIGRPGTQTATFIAGINGVTSSGGLAVYINANGRLGTNTSSRRFKEGASIRWTKRVKRSWRCAR